MAALFNDRFLRTQVAMRGGTLLHKVHLAPASRFSEDIDLVVFGDRPEDHIRKALRRVLLDVLGKPKSAIWESIGLAIRNTVKPSRVLRLSYSVPSISEPGKALVIVIEANVTERTPHRQIVETPFVFSFRKERVSTCVNGFDIHEMLGTKMRALFQRKRGRDLFDLYWALTQSPTPIDPDATIMSFLHYLRMEGAVVGRADFLDMLDSHLADGGFCSDMDQLLRSGLVYDPHAAGEYVKINLLAKLPENCSK
jgi:predicted nucleotidyltransferase component of viral defense system